MEMTKLTEMAKRMAPYFHLVLVAVVGCSQADSPSRAFFNERSPGYVKLVETGAVCDTCIRARRLTGLGDSTGAGILVPPWWAVQKDHAGNYWVGQNGTVKVFNADGRFIHQVGRLGRGPLEFSANPAPFYSDASGAVHVYDPAQRRITVVSRNFTRVADRNLPGSPFALVGLRGGSRYVANMWLQTADRIGLPLHLIEADSIIGSFGLTEHDTAVSPFSARRLISADADDRVVAAKAYQYVVDFWSPAGKHLGRVEGLPLNERPLRLGQRNELQNEIYAVRLDDSRYLWVVTSYVWRRDGNVVSTTSSYTTSDTGTSDFSLEVQVTDANSRTASDSRTVQVTGSGQIICE